MISILLIILKIIGITLLVILGVFLLLLLLVLVVPVRYRIKGSYEEAFQCKGSISWLLHVISIRFEVGKEVVTTIRILGIPLSFFAIRRRKKPQEAVGKDSSEKNLSVADTPKEESASVTIQSSETAETNMVAGAAKGSQAETLNDSAAGMGESLKEEKSILQKITDKIFSVWNKVITAIAGACYKFKNTLHGILEKIKNVIKKIKDFIQDIKDKKKNLKRYIRILQSDTTKAAFALCKKKLFKVLKHIFPRKLRADITFGFEDPATTGYSLAVYGMLPAFVGKGIRLHPDFDNPVLKADFRAKGALRAGTLLFHILGILLDKNCRRLYRIVKKEMANEHK